jgi:hypothetical protein
MATARIEIPTGEIDGVNTRFYVSTPYKVGSVQLFLNGQLKVKEYDDGCVEISSVDRCVDTKEPPLPGDTVQFYFVDTTEDSDAENIVVGGTTGSLTVAEATALIAQIPTVQPAAEVRGAVVGTALTAGVQTITVSNTVSGTITSGTPLIGVVKDHC